MHSMVFHIVLHDLDGHARVFGPVRAEEVAKAVDAGAKCARRMNVVVREPVETLFKLAAAHVKADSEEGKAKVPEPQGGD